MRPKLFFSPSSLFLIEVSLGAVSLGAVSLGAVSLGAVSLGAVSLVLFPGHRMWEEYRLELVIEFIAKAQLGLYRLISMHTGQNIDHR